MRNTNVCQFPKFACRGLSLLKKKWTIFDMIMTFRKRLRQYPWILLSYNIILSILYAPLHYYNEINSYQIQNIQSIAVPELKTDKQCTLVVQYLLKKYYDLEQAVFSSFYTKRAGMGNALLEMSFWLFICDDKK